MSLLQLNKSLQAVIEKKNLSFGEAYETMLELMSGEASDTQIGALLSVLKAKGETYEEIAGFAEGMKEKAEKLNINYKEVIDTCGTGGDRAGTFNISTTSAFVLAGAGAVVAKHGNRSISSKSGSADVLTALGVNIDKDVSAVEKILNHIGIAFLFAPKMHLSMKYVMKARKELGIPTVFNVLGPLTNPVKLTGQVLGVYRKDLVMPMARVLHKLGRKRAIVVHGAGNLDEAALCGDNYTVFVSGDSITEKIINAKDYGLSEAGNNEILGGTAEENAKITMDILNGKIGPQRDVVVLNSALGMITAGLADSVEQGIELAKDSIDSGKAKDKLKKLIELSNAI